MTWKAELLRGPASRFGVFETEKKQGRPAFISPKNSGAVAHKRGGGSAPVNGFGPRAGSERNVVAGTDKFRHDLFQARLVEIHFQLVTLDAGHCAIAKLLVKHPVSKRKA